MTTADQGGSDPLLRLDVVTVFPDYLAPLHLALLGRAVDRGIVSIGVHDLRDWTHDVHRSVDDTPFGGGPGMVMRPTVWGEALDDLVGSPSVDDSPPRWNRPHGGTTTSGHYWSSRHPPGDRSPSLTHSATPDASTCCSRAVDTRGSTSASSTRHRR